MRCFRCLAGDEVYEQIRLTLDAEWGHPNAETKTVTCVDPAAVAPRDAQGRIMLAVDASFCEYAEVAAILPALLASGSVEEIGEAAYVEAVSRAP